MHNIKTSSRSSRCSGISGSSRKSKIYFQNKKSIWAKVPAVPEVLKFQKVPVREIPGVPVGPEVPEDILEKKMSKSYKSLRKKQIQDR